MGIDHPDDRFFRTHGPVSFPCFLYSGYIKEAGPKARRKPKIALCRETEGLSKETDADMKQAALPTLNGGSAAWLLL
jgi:hypothetical protein